MKLISKDDGTWECPACGNHTDDQDGSGGENYVGFEPVDAAANNRCLKCGNVYSGVTDELLRNDPSE